MDGSGQSSRLLVENPNGSQSTFLLEEALQQQHLDSSLSRGPGPVGAVLGRARGLAYSSTLRQRNVRQTQGIVCIEIPVLSPYRVYEPSQRCASGQEARNQ